MAQYLTRPQVEYLFTIRLRLDLGHGHLVLALTTNLESGPCFAKIWYSGHEKIRYSKESIIQIPSVP